MRVSHRAKTRTWPRLLTPLIIIALCNRYNIYVPDECEADWLTNPQFVLLSGLASPCHVCE